MEQKSVIKGKFILTIYRHPETMYTVAKFRLYEVEEKDITVTGYFPVLPKDTLYSLEGEYITHQKYGMQFQVSHFQRQLPTDTESIISYLSGPQFPGIGKIYATQMVEILGENLIDKIKEDPSVLDFLPKMTDKRREALIDGIINQNDLQQAIEFFSTYGLGIRNIMKIDRKYGKEALPLIKENPYRLVEDIDGIGFNTADKVATSMGFDENDPLRLQAALVYMVLQHCMKTGDSYIEYEELRTLFEKEFSGDLDFLLFEISKRRLVIQEESRIYHFSQFDAEDTIATYLQRFPLEYLPQVEEAEMNHYLPEIQKQIGIEYDQKQIEAIHTFFQSDFSILTGGPGTGKTTVVRGMIGLVKWLYPHYTIALCAPTGRAAKRLSELTDTEAYTIHSLLKWDLESNTFGMNESEPLALDILIVDEFSMVDQWLFSNLTKAGKNIKKILLIGDEDQLPSVSPGCLLKDLIETNLYPVSRLEKIFRQKEGSDVIELAHHIRKQEIEEVNFQGDVRFIECSNYEVKEAVLQIVQEALNKGYSVNDLQILAPKYSGVAGIDALNHELQQFCNPQAFGKEEIKVGYRIFREGDKILQLKNQPEDNVYNGDIGILVEIDKSSADEISLIVDFDGTFVEYRSDLWSNLTHAYAISIHKSQGSEYPIVIIPFVREHLFMLQRRLIYTAISRASKSLVLLGSKEIFLRGIQQKEHHQRKTTLVERVQKKIAGIFNN